MREGLRHKTGSEFSADVSKQVSFVFFVLSQVLCVNVAAPRTDRQDEPWAGLLLEMYNFNVFFSFDLIKFQDAF